MVLDGGGPIGVVGIEGMEEVFLDSVDGRGGLVSLVLSRVG